MRYLPRVLRYLRPHWRAALVSFSATVLVSLLALLEPWPLKVLFDSVLGSVPLPRPISGSSWSPSTALGHSRSRER